MPSAVPSAPLQATLNASAILPLTKSGASTAHNVSKFRPAAPILAITRTSQVARKLAARSGV